MAETKINIPIGLAAKVAKVLGTSKRSVGNLCTHANINKWAKCKPFNCSLPSFEKETYAATDSAAEQAKSRQYWREKEGTNYGLKLPSIATSGKYTSFAEESWTYVARTAPFRIGDFNGYEHNARMPFEYFKNITLSKLFDTKIDFYREAITSDDVVPVLDMLKKLLNGGSESGDMFVGVYFYDNGIDTYLTFDPTARGIATGTISSQIQYPRTINFNLFVTNKARTSMSGTPEAANFLPMPWDKSIEEIKGTITVNFSDPFNLSDNKNFTGIRNVGGSWEDAEKYIPGILQTDQLERYFRVSGQYTIQLRFKVVNNSGTARTIYAGNIRVTTRSTFNNTSYTGSVALVDGSGHNSISSITIGAGQTADMDVRLPSSALYGNSSPPTAAVRKAFTFDFSYNNNQWFTRTVNLACNT